MRTIVTVRELETLLAGLPVKCDTIEGLPERASEGPDLVLLDPDLPQIVAAACQAQFVRDRVWKRSGKQTENDVVATVCKAAADWATT